MVSTIENGPSAAQGSGLSDPGGGVCACGGGGRQGQATPVSERFRWGGRGDIPAQLQLFGTRVLPEVGVRYAFLQLA